MITEFPRNDITWNDQQKLTEWLNGLASDKKRDIAAALLTGTLNQNQPIPVEVISQTIRTEVQSLEAFLLKNLENLSHEENPDLKSKPQVASFYNLIRLAKLSIINRYLQEPYNRYQTLSFRRYGQSNEAYINTSIDFASLSVFGDYRDSSFSRGIPIDEIDDINWLTEAGDLQRIYSNVGLSQRSMDRLIATLGRLITVRKLEAHINDVIEDYSDIFNIQGLVSHKKIRKFEEWLTDAEKVNIPVVDNEIKRTYGRFIERLETKVAMLKERDENHAEKEKKETIIDGGPAIHLHESEVAGGYTYRLIKNDPAVTRIELIHPKELNEKEANDFRSYFKIPYFASAEQQVETVPFTLTEWHLSLLSQKMPQLWANQSTNTMFMGLAGTGKDYFIKWLCSLMNVKQCSFDCRQVEEINDLFYIRRIKDGADYFVPTDIYHVIQHQGCLLYLAEVNKLGEKFSDLNSMHDFKREIYIPVDGKTYPLPPGNLIFASANPAWFGGGRSRLEPDVKDRYQNMINYDYLPFFHSEKNQRLGKYFSHEAEIRYNMFPQLEKLGQLKVRQLWKRMFNSSYDDTLDSVNFKQGNPYIRAMIVLKRVMHFVNLYRHAYEQFRKAQSDTVATEMLTQRGVEEIIARIVGIDRNLDDFETYRQVILRYMRERFEDVDENMKTVEQFLKD